MSDLSELPMHRDHTPVSKLVRCPNYNTMSTSSVPCVGIKELSRDIKPGDDKDTTACIGDDDPVNCIKYWRRTTGADRPQERDYERSRAI